MSLSWETLWPNREVDWSQLSKPNSFEWKYGVTPLSQAAVPLFGASGYLLTLYILKKVMANRKGLELHFISQVHNLLLCSFSLVVLCGQIYATINRVQETGLADLFCETRANPIRGPEYFWGYLYYVSKYYDFFDTILLVLKKRPLNFLHVYHHAIVPIAVWYGIMADFGMPMWTACLFNSAVHLVMYYYYFLVGCGVRVWWKKYVTVFQLVQFMSGMVFACFFGPMYFKNIVMENTRGAFSISFDKGCTGDFGSLVFVGFVNVSFLFLFARFYVRTYAKKPEQHRKNA